MAEQLEEGIARLLYQKESYRTRSSLRRYSYGQLPKFYKDKLVSEAKQIIVFLNEQGYVKLVDDQCCMTCQRMKICPIIVAWVKENDSPSVVHTFHCSEYKQERPQTQEAK